MIIRTIAKKETTKRVAAYARVSTLAESQEESYETQVKYYSDLISSVKDWSMVKIYADRGITGTSAEKRPGFQEMIRDASAGKIDIILCKSISRFARNVEEAQRYVHDLKALGIEIRFEKDGLSTSDPQMDLVLGMKMVIAQQESKSISENIKWANLRLAEQGIHHVGKNHLLGYDETDGVMTPNKDKWIIELIFQMYADGISIPGIVDQLNEKGAKTLRKKADFKYSTVMSILRNEVYCGDRNILKTPSRNYLTKKADLTVKRKTHFVKNHHAAIVSRELWDAAQEHLKRDAEAKAAGILPRKDSHPYYGRIICACCGRPYRRSTRKSKNGDLFPVWRCAGRIHGECSNRIIRESDLDMALQGRGTIKVTESGLVNA